jgi:hypothetical protein
MRGKSLRLLDVREMAGTRIVTNFASGTAAANARP